MNVGSLGSTTDSLGRFRIDNVPVGRCNIQTSYVGYNTNIFNEIPVTSSKEVYMEITLMKTFTRWRKSSYNRR